MSHPVLVVSDVHGNLPALKAVLRDAAGQAGAIWVLGDVAGYGPDPGACIDMLRSLDALMVAGNHDLAAAGKLDTGSFSSDAEAAALIHRRILSDDHKQFLSGLPEIIVEKSVSLSHGDPRNPLWGYVLNTPAAAGVLAEAVTSLTLLGHSHLQALWAYDPVNGARMLPIEYGRTVSYAGMPHLANPGSVGQPRDGDPSAGYMIVDPERKTLEFRRCRWRSGSLRRRMRKDGSPETLIRRMDSGE